jgi:hypothetical protein
MLRKTLVIATLYAAGLVLCANEANAQCSTRDVLRNATIPKTAPVVANSAGNTGDDAAFRVWKTITLGEFANSFALRDALDAADCGIGDLAEEILARPAFTLVSTKTDVDLVVVSAADLGFENESVSLDDIYSRAEQFGLVLAPAEVGPALRLHYFDQPIGEFLHVGMKPITTWKGERGIFVVANGGAGLILIGQHGSADTQMDALSKILFVRPPERPKAPKENTSAVR